jgi:DNA recombination protein RmuC
MRQGLEQAWTALLRELDPWLAGAFVAGILLTMLLGGAYGRRRMARERALAGEQAEQRRQVEAAAFELHLAESRHALERAQGRLEQLEDERAEQRARLAEQSRELAERQAAEAALEARLEESRKAFAEKEALFRESSEALKREFELLANRVFDRQGERHQAKLADVLAPLRDQLADFRKRVDTVYASDTRERASLLTEVRNLQRASERINREAENLTRALKGDVKTQGNWGEMVLERVLESSGLRQGHEYFLQEARRDGEGRLKRPDARIRLPDGKDVVVDAKLSLLAYEEALAEEDPVARDDALSRHVASLRAHVKRLAEQGYEALEGIRSLDFVLLFVPIEAAFTLAMEHDQKLFSEAFERRIVIVSPTTLMMTLRIIHHVWRREQQNRNAREIARRAGALYDKLRGFVDDMESLGRQLEAADSSYKAAFGKLSTGRGNLLRQAESLRELGAPVKKPLPRQLVDGAALETSPLDADDGTAHTEPAAGRGGSAN